MKSIFYILFGYFLVNDNPNDIATTESILCLLWNGKKHGLLVTERIV